jgi:hypothetical protein
MHRTIEITVSSAHTERLCHELEPLKHVIGLSVNRGVSIKPPGDCITVHVLNRGADDVLRRVQAISATKTVRVASANSDRVDSRKQPGTVSIVTAELTSIIDPEQQTLLENDVDTGLWEEMEESLRHQGHVTPNYFILMALGGAIAAIGLVSEPAQQAIAFTAGSVIAPGFEPVAKIPLGLALRRWNLVRRGLVSVVLGYMVLVIASALIMRVLLATNTVTVAEFIGNPQVEHISHPTLKEILESACAAVAGIVMITAYRLSVIAGPLMALFLIPAAAMIGGSVAAGQSKLIWEAFERLGLDVLFIIVLGVIVFLIKQAFVHRRQPMV